MIARSLCILLIVLVTSSVGGCRSAPPPAAKLTWVEVDMTLGSDHPAARRLRELSMAVGEERSKGVRPLTVGELDVLLDQIIRDGVGRPLAYVSIGLGGVPSEARSYSSRPGSRRDGESPRGVFLSVDMRPVPGSPAEYVIVSRDMGGSTDGWSGGRSGSKIDVRRDVGKVLGGGRGTTGDHEHCNILVVEPVEPVRDDFYYRAEDILPGRAD